jgi:ABC-type glycerol-3-phosphate transport system permease component
LAVITLLPIVWLVYSAFRPEDEILQNPFGFSMNFTLQNFKGLFNIDGLSRSISNSVIVALLTTLITACTAIIIGYFLARYKFPGRIIVRLVAYSGYLLAPAILILPYTQMLYALGLTDTIAGIIFAHTSFCLPFALALADIIFRSIPISIEEVALLQGVGLFPRLTKILIPAARIQFAALFVLVFTISWKEFFFAFIISSGTDSRTLPVLLATFYGGEAVNWHLLCALAVVLMLPMLVLFFSGKLFRVLPLTGGGTRG